jgi:hypothetical protein
VVMLEVMTAKKTSSRLLYGLTVTALVEIAGLAPGLYRVLEFPANREPQEVLNGRERTNIE